MESEMEYHLTLDQLNEDILFLIFQELHLSEQLTVLKVHSNFKNTIMRMWNNKYSGEIDFKSEPLRSLTSAELKDILPLIASDTKALLNIDELLYNDYFQGNVFEKIVKITARFPTLARNQPETNVLFVGDLPKMSQSFPKLETLHLQEPPVDLEDLSNLSSLTELQLVHCTLAPDDLDWAAVLEKFRLKSFTLLSRKKHARAEVRLFKCIRNCTTLQRFALNSYDFRIAFKQFRLLPQLQRLRVYTFPTKVADKVPHGLHEILRELGSSPFTMNFIKSVRFNCNFSHLDDLHRMPNLRLFAWHFPKHLVIIEDILPWYSYDVLPWYPHDIMPWYPDAVMPWYIQVTYSAVLRLMRFSTTLREVDLRFNSNITGCFVEHVLRMLPQPAKGDPPTRVRSAFSEGDESEDESDYDLCDITREVPEEPPIIELRDYGYFEMEFLTPVE